MLITLQALENSLEMIHTQILEEGPMADLMAQKYELEAQIEEILSSNDTQGGVLDGHC